MRLLLLMPATTYRADDFLAAAKHLGAEVVTGTDRCHLLDELGVVAPTLRDSLVLDFADPAASAATIEEYARTKSIDGVIATDDTTTVVAALAAERLGLAHNPASAAAASKDKLAAHERFAAAGVRQARFRVIPTATPPRDAAVMAAADPGFPCVIKPRWLSASRGVMRADDAASFAERFARLQRLLADPELNASGGDRAGSILVESFVPGAEVALEGVLTAGSLDVLALFDKPDPLDGPFFEETLYVQPSRLPAGAREDVIDQARRAMAALGLTEGPVHAELRVHPTGGAHVLEVAARAIGGLCSRTLRFGTGMSLEEILVRHAIRRAGAAPPHPALSPRASGVLMIPIPMSGLFRGVEGVEDARAIPGIEEVTITAVPGRELLALPEGAAYLGFAFARGETPADVESALRAARARLDVKIIQSLAKVS